MLQRRLEGPSHDFFARPEVQKGEVGMAKARPAWRAWFPLRGEITSGVPDREEGLYVGLEHPHDQPLTYGEYLSAKVVRVFPDLFAEVTDA